MKLQDKVAIVTGGGTGMGRAAALRLALEGANVVVAGRRRSELDSVVAEIRANHGRALAVPTDVGDERQIEALVRATLDEFGALHMAWNNAGVLGAFTPAHQTDLEELDRLLRINFRGVFACIKHEIAAMLELGVAGAIVNTSSWTAQRAVGGTAVYAASKAALDALARTAALEVGPSGIRINNVSPGIIATPMSRAALGSDDAMAPFQRQTPLRRIGQPDDVGDVVLWLLSDDARFVTGESILVDGGFTLGAVPV